MAQENEGVKFIGTPPPKIQAQLKEIKKEQQQEKDISQKDPFANIEKLPPSGKVRKTGSYKLEELLEQIRPQVYVYDEIKLPSRGMFYNGKDGPTDGIVHIRPMIGEEEQILATPRFIKKGVAINMIFKNCIKEVVKPDELLSIDRTHILIALRNISYGHNYEVEIKCSNCDKKFPHTIDLSQLMVNPCPKDMQLIDVLPKSKLEFSWHLPRGKDETLITEYRERRTKEFEGAIDDSMLYRLALMIDDIKGLTDKFELLVLLKKLSTQDITYLKNIINNPAFGVDTKCQAMCAYCYEEFDVELPLEAGFFSPRHKRKQEKMESETTSDSSDI